jgi:hypothetical protein
MTGARQPTMPTQKACFAGKPPRLNAHKWVFHKNFIMISHYKPYRLPLHAPLISRPAARALLSPLAEIELSNRTRPSCLRLPSTAKTCVELQRTTNLLRGVLMAWICAFFDARFQRQPDLHRRSEGKRTHITLDLYCEKSCNNTKKRGYNIEYEQTRTREKRQTPAHASAHRTTSVQLLENAIKDWNRTRLQKHSQRLRSFRDENQMTPQKRKNACKNDCGV